MGHRRVDILQLTVYDVPEGGDNMVRADELLEYILGHIEIRGYQPSFSEMIERFGATSYGISRGLKELEEIGAIQLTGRDRAIEFPRFYWDEERGQEWVLPAGESVVLDGIREYIRRGGYQPTLQDIASGIGVSVKTVMKRMRGLEKAGVIIGRGIARANQLNGSRWIVKERGNG